MGQLWGRLSQYWNKIQGTLFPFLEEELDPLTEKQQQLIAVRELVRIEQFLPDRFGLKDAPKKLVLQLHGHLSQKWSIIWTQLKLCWNA